MKNRILILAISLSTLSSLATPIVFSSQVQWDYTNYLYLFNISEFDDPFIAGRINRISMIIGANTDVMLHVEFKGRFSWGEWIFYSQEILVDAGINSIDVDIEIPIKTIVEPTCTYYYYVYITLPEDGWAPYVWGLTKYIPVASPSEIKIDDVRLMLGHIAWMLTTSDLPDLIKEPILSKLDSLRWVLEYQFHVGNIEEIQTFIDRIIKIKNSFCESKRNSHEYWYKLTDALV